MIVECMTVVACLKLLHKYDDHCSEYSTRPISRILNFDLIIIIIMLAKHVFWSIRLPGCLPSSLICVKIMTEVVTQSCRNVYHTIIMIIHSANLNKGCKGSFTMFTRHQIWYLAS